MKGKRTRTVGQGLVAATLVIGVMAVVSSAAYANGPFYVTPAATLGSPWNTHSCLSSAQACSISRALLVEGGAGSPGEIQMRDGDYTNPGNDQIDAHDGLGTPNNGVTIIGGTSGTTTLKPRADCLGPGIIDLSAADDVTVESLTVNAATSACAAAVTNTGGSGESLSGQTTPAADAFVITGGAPTNAVDLSGGSTTLDDVTVDPTYTGDGISCSGSARCTVSSSTVTGTTGSTGILVSGAAGAAISGTTVSGNSAGGVVLEGSSGTTVGPNNSLSDNAAGAVLLEAATGATVSDNTLGSNGAGGIIATSNNDEASNDTVSGNTVSGNTAAGIELEETGGVTISGNSIDTGASGIGIVLVDSDGNTVSSNSVSDSQAGLYAGGNDLSGPSNDNTVTGNDFSNNELGGAVTDGYGSPESWNRPGSGNQGIQGEVFFQSSVTLGTGDTAGDDGYSGAGAPERVWDSNTLDGDYAGVAEYLADAGALCGTGSIPIDQDVTSPGPNLSACTDGAGSIYVEGDVVSAITAVSQATADQTTSTSGVDTLTLSDLPFINTVAQANDFSDNTWINETIAGAIDGSGPNETQPGGSPTGPDGNPDNPVAILNSWIDNFCDPTTAAPQCVQKSPRTSFTATTPADQSIELGASTTDAATVTGDDTAGSPTQTVSFYQCGPTPTPEPCTTEADPVGGPTAVSPGPDDTATATSVPFSPTSPGYWCFAGYYSGDAKYFRSADTSTDECVAVTGVSTAPVTTTIALGESDTDTATVTGNASFGSPTQTVTFYQCGPTPTPEPCLSQADPLGGAVGVTPTPNDTATATSVPFTPDAAGYWCFAGDYSGDANYPSISDTSTDECFFVTGSDVATTTTTPDSSSIVQGQSITDVAAVSGNVNDGAPTGTVTFSLCGPTAQAVSPDPCTGGTDQVGSPVALVAGAGDASTATSASFTPLSPGFWCFDNTYSGDANYAPSSDSSTDECVDVTALPSSSSDYAGFAVITTSGSPRASSDEPRSSGRAAQPDRTHPASSSSSASTTFTVPTETCTSVDTGVIVGSGIFSAVSGWVSAAGVVVACQGGVAVYSAQEVVNNAVTNLALTPAAGDTVTTTVDIVPGQTKVTVDDVTQDRSSTMTVPVGSVGTYISDGIDGDGDPDALPVPSFGAISFSNSSIDGKTLTAAGAVAVSRVTNGDLQILVGPLNPAGTGFGQTFESSGTSVTSTTSAPTASSIVLGQSNTDTATVTGNQNGGPTGTVTFSLCGPTTTPKAPSPCTGGSDHVGNPVALVPGSGDTSTAVSGSFTPTAPGYWCFDNTYSGDGNYAPSSDDTTDECFEVTPAPLQVTTTSLPSTSRLTSYSTTLTASGGTLTYKWKKVSGRLPAGLMLSRRTGKITGTTSANAVTSTFTVKVTDRSHPKQSATATLTITVS